MKDGETEMFKLEINGLLSDITMVNVSVSSVDVQVAAIAIPSLRANSSLQIVVKRDSNEEMHRWKPGQHIGAIEGSNVDVVLTAVDHDGFNVTMGVQSFTIVIEDGQGGLRLEVLKPSDKCYRAQILSFAKSGAQDLFLATD